MEKANEEYMTKRNNETRRIKEEVYDVLIKEFNDYKFYLDSETTGFFVKLVVDYNKTSTRLDYFVGFGYDAHGTETVYGDIDNYFTNFSAEDVHVGFVIIDESPYFGTCNKWKITEIETANKDSALAVPLSALKTDKNGTYVIVIKDDGTTENRYVETGIYGDEFVEIINGLSENEKVDVTMVKKITTATSARPGPPIH